MGESRAMVSRTESKSPSMPSDLSSRGRSALKSDASAIPDDAGM